MTPGELDASGFTGYLTNSTVTGMLAQKLNGSTIVLEHRFFGTSNPYDTLTVKAYQVHTIKQAIDDLEYFAKNVKLPQPNGDQLTPGKAPWIMVGGSYPGALTSYAMYKCVFVCCVTVCARSHHFLTTASPIFSTPDGRLPVSSSHLREYTSFSSYLKQSDRSGQQGLLGILRDRAPEHPAELFI